LPLDCINRDGSAVQPNRADLISCNTGVAANLEDADD
jgi:hypothetical protein